MGGASNPIGDYVMRIGFDETSGTAIADTGSLQNMGLGFYNSSSVLTDVGPYSVPGAKANAVDCGAAHSIMNQGGLAPFGGLTAMTFVACVKPVNLVSNTPIFRQWDSEVSLIMNLRLSSKYFMWGVGNGSVERTIEAPSLSLLLNEWNVLIGTWNGSTDELTITHNGDVQTVRNVSATPVSVIGSTTAAIYINRWNATLFGTFTCDEYLAYDRVLSASEIQHLTNWLLL